MSFEGIVIILITAIGLYFLIWERIKKSKNISRLFYVLSIIAFYFGMFNAEAGYNLEITSVWEVGLLVIIEGVLTGLIWFIIALIIDSTHNKRIKKSAKLPIADEIRKLAQLRDEGILTEEEFNQQKHKFLSD